MGKVKKLDWLCIQFMASIYFCAPMYEKVERYITVT
jgi:hypothetical protein